MPKSGGHCPCAPYPGRQAPSRDLASASANASEETWMQPHPSSQRSSSAPVLQNRPRCSMLQPIQRPGGSGCCPHGPGISHRETFCPAPARVPVAGKRMPGSHSARSAEQASSARVTGKRLFGIPPTDYYLDCSHCGAKFIRRKTGSGWSRSPIFPIRAGGSYLNSCRKPDDWAALVREESSARPGLPHRHIPGTAWLPGKP